MKLKRGSTSVRRLIFIGDSSSTTGAGLANLLHNTSGLVAYYFAGDLSNEVSIPLASATLGSYTDGGFVAVDNTNMPGWYEFGIPNGALDGGNEVAIQLRGAANMVPVNIYIELDAVDYQDATAFGLSRLDAAVSSRMATYTQPTGFLAATFPTTVASPTNITSASGVVLAATTHTGAVIPTVSTVTNAVTAGTVTDKTGYSLASNGLASITSWSVAITGNITGNLSGSVGSVTGNVGGNVTGSVGSIAGVTFPAGFGTWTAPLTTSGTASAVWDALLASYTVAGSFGARVVRSVNSNNTIQLTGSNHAAADIHELQPAVIDNTHFAAGAFDANALAASAATEIATAVGTLQVLTDLVTMIVNDGTANARFSTSALQNAPSGGGGGGTGTGARTVAITVTLSAAPVEGASVRLTKAAETYVGTTNASGQITFNVDDGTWAVAITSPNATFAGASLVVDDDETVSYSLTAISITPSPAGQMTGYWTCYSHLGVVESGVSVTMQLVDVPKGSKGLALDSKTRTVTANGSGVAQFTNLFPGCRYKVYRGAADNKAFYVTLPEVAPADPVELGSFYGDDE